MSRWITLGNPLGEPGVRDNLYDAADADDGRYPNHIVDRWINVAAHDDFVAHDEDIANDFKAMTDRRLIGSIDDRRIYNFWVGTAGSNPHKFYGYLDHPDVAKDIANRIR